MTAYLAATVVVLNLLILAELADRAGLLDWWHRVCEWAGLS